MTRFVEQREEEMVAMFYRVRREPLEGTAIAACRVHAQACGFVAYSFDVHPDHVAQAVASFRERCALPPRPVRSQHERP
jgi:hypothetical protein